MMDEQSVGLSDPPLTRRELRRSEEAAHALERGQEAARQELPPPAPVQPVPASPGPRNSPSGRVPQWAIDDAAGETPQNTAWREAPAPVGYDWESGQPGSETGYVSPAIRYPSPVKRFFRAFGRTISDIVSSLWRLTKFLLLTSILVVGLWNGLIHLAPGFTADAGRVLASHGISNPFAEAFPWTQPPVTSNGPGSPPPGAGASEHPLGAPAPMQGNSNSYAFLSPGIDQPFTSYDPCRPIHYVVRPDNAPVGGERMIAEAVAEVSRATGFVFINDGITSENPADDRPAHQVERYGDRWAPVLFAWETWAEEPKFTENWMPGSSTTLGLGGSMAVTVDDRESTYVTGQIRLNAAALGAISGRSNGHAKVRAVVQHELAHVLGLDHVGDPTQLMSATIDDRITDFAAGDLTGLAILGQGECRPGI